MKKPSYYIADFDSTTSAYTSIANFLHGKKSSTGGLVPDIPSWGAKFINSLSEKTRQTIYRMSGWYDAFPPGKIKDIKTEDFALHIINQYPGKKYKGVMTGSANGAAAYLAAALHIPYLPQTLLLPVRRKLSPDDLRGDIEWAKPYADVLLKNNPGIALYQMHDPVQDRLMVQRMAYFRIKQLNMPAAYINFISNYVEEGGIIISVECNLKWPVTTVNSRHFFQSGGLGALEPGDLQKATPDIEEFLQRHNAGIKRFDVPGTDTEAPEAEWGFVPELLKDLKKTAQKNNLSLYRIGFEKPDDFSPFSADIYRSWYKENNMNTESLIAECFALIDPLLVQKKSLVPYWLAFNTNPSAECFSDYLEASPLFDYIYLKLMSNGINSIGIADVNKWKAAAGKAVKKYSFLGMDEKKYPLDLGSYGRFNIELNEEVYFNYPVPPPLSFNKLLDLYNKGKGKYKIDITRDD